MLFYSVGILLLIGLWFLIPSHSLPVRIITFLAILALVVIAAGIALHMYAVRMGDPPAPGAVPVVVPGPGRDNTPTQ